MADRNRADPDRRDDMPENRREAPGGRDARGEDDRGPARGAPGGAAVGEVGRLRGEAGGSDLAGGADLAPRADVARLASRAIDDVDHNDEAD